MTCRSLYGEMKTWPDFRAASRAVYSASRQSPSDRTGIPPRCLITASFSSETSRQIDRRRRPRVAGRVTHAHPMIAGRGGNHASAQLLVVERENLVRRAAEFERSG